MSISDFFQIQNIIFSVTFFNSSVHTVLVTDIYTSLPLCMFSCGKTGLASLRHREDQHVDNRRSGGPRGGGRHYNKYPVLETLPHWQTGLPARHHEHHPTKTEGERLKTLCNDSNEMFSGILKHCFAWDFFFLSNVRFICRSFWFVLLLYLLMCYWYC